jgi:hypothetical protein
MIRRKGRKKLGGGGRERGTGKEWREGNRQGRTDGWREGNIDLGSERMLQDAMEGWN